MKINWKVRFKNKAFCMTFVAAFLLLVSFVLRGVGVEVCNKDWWAIVEAILIAITMVGVAIDPTTNGIGDSELVTYYAAPRKSGELEDIYFIAKGMEEMAEVDSSNVDNQFAQAVENRPCVDDLDEKKSSKKSVSKESVSKKTYSKKVTKKEAK